ncbi:sensor histidine kinase [Nonomuraea typhae]|uniref:Sensor histidine kinase n=1 Tax=Nonomuraea typhae TaxID=2603600 RepID=A0ABW7YV22_9ACTN
MGAFSDADVDRLLRVEPVREAMSRMAAGLRGSAVVVVVPSALLGLAELDTPGWAILALVVLSAWTGLYGAICWIRGLERWMAGLDVLMASVFCLFIGELVPAEAIPGGASWVAGLASLTVIAAQLAGGLRISVPVSLLVPAALFAGSALVGVSAANQTMVLCVQALAAAATMIVATRTGEAAARVFTELQAQIRRLEIGRAAREDARSHLRIIHNGPLTTLTIALQLADPQPGAALRRHAAADLRELSRSAQEAREEPERLVRLDRRLPGLADRHAPQLTVTMELEPAEVPATIAAAFTEAAKESLANVFKHAGVGRAAIRLTADGPLVRVTVRDEGRGFDPRRTGFGLREAVTGTMTAAGGSAAIRSAPGEGTTIVLEWRHE